MVSMSREIKEVFFIPQVSGESRASRGQGALSGCSRESLLLRRGSRGQLKAEKGSLHLSLRPI